MDVCPQSLHVFAQGLADLSGPVARRHFRARLPIDDKADASPVTAADREIESLLRAAIACSFPEHGIVGEEFDSDRPDADYVWVIDPIDGTRAFITGKPTFGTLIALLYQGRPCLGVIDMPALGERWIGAKGAPTFHNGEAVTVRPCARLSEAYFYATSPHMFAPGREDAVYRRMAAAVKSPLYGADCYHYGLLASGFCDLVLEAGLKPYDFCALVPVLEGAGGVVTDWAGQPLGLDSEGQVLATGNAALHAQALEMIRS